ALDRVVDAPRGIALVLRAVCAEAGVAEVHLAARRAGVHLGEPRQVLLHAEGDEVLRRLRARRLSGLALRVAFAGGAGAPRRRGAARQVRGLALDLLAQRDAVRRGVRA